MLNSNKLYKSVYTLCKNVFCKENFENKVILEYPEDGQLDTLRICNDTKLNTIKKNIRIIICDNSEEMFSTNIGDNPKKYLEFAVFEDDDMEENSRVKEGRWIIFNDEKYIVKKVYKTPIIGHTYLKDCIAYKRR